MLGQQLTRKDHPYKTLFYTVNCNIKTSSLVVLSMNYYRPQRSCEGYVFTPVCHSVHGGVCLSACWDTTPPDQAHPPPEHIPLGLGTKPLLPGAPPPRDQAPRWSTTPRTRYPPGADPPSS